MLKETQMKLILTLITMLLLFTAPAFSDITDTDINRIRLVVKEEVETAIEASEKRMKEYVSQKIDNVNTKISEMDKRLNQVFLTVLGILGFITVFIGVPQIIVAMQRKDIRAQDEKIKTLQSQIETLQADKADVGKSELPDLSD